MLVLYRGPNGSNNQASYLLIVISFLSIEGMDDKIFMKKGLIVPLRFQTVTC